MKPPKDEFVTVDEAAKIMKVSRRWVYKLMSLGSLPYEWKYNTRVIARKNLGAK